MSLPQTLIHFAKACQARFGDDVAGYNKDGAFVAVEDRVINVNLDQNANRAVVWTELDRPDYAEMDALEQVAMTYTRRELIAKGFVVGINRRADLILLGRSIEQDVLGKTEGFDLVTEVAKEANAASAALANAVKTHGGSLPGSDGLIILN
jgi:hypothetical protein